MASAVAGLATGMGMGIGYGVLSEYARLGVLWAKWKAWGKSACPDKVAGCLQKLLSAEKDPVTGLSSKGATDTIVEFMDMTLDLAWMIDESIATQMFVQMIQQSIAYAIHSSHAGSIGTIGNVYSGSTYLPVGTTPKIGSKTYSVGGNLRGFLGAEVGENIPTLAFNLLSGGHDAIDDTFGRMLRQTDGFLDEWNDLALDYYRHMHSMARTRFANALEMKEDAVTRAYGLLEQIANEHLARISEQLDTLNGAKAWFDAGLMSDDELKDFSVRIDLEREASENNYDEVKEEVLDAIDSAVTEWSVKINVAYGDLTVNETYYALLIREFFSQIFTCVVHFVDSLVYELEVVIDNVCAYRNTEKCVEFVPWSPPPIIPPPPVIQHGIKEELAYFLGKVWIENFPRVEQIAVQAGSVQSESFPRIETVTITNV